MSTTLPTVGELIENNPGLDVGGYGLGLLLKAPPSNRMLALEATTKRKMAQPHGQLKFMHRVDIEHLCQVANYLNHASPKVRDRARAVLMEIASRAQALAEAGDDLESVLDATMDRCLELR